MNRPQYWLRQPTGTLKVGNIGQRILELQIAVQGHDDAGVHAVMDQRLGQGTCNIGQTAGFGKGIAASLAAYRIFMSTSLQSTQMSEGVPRLP